jgi:hypothetical protein
MVQVIGQEGLGELLGGGLSEGLSSGLQMLMQAKMKSLQDMNALKGISALAGGGADTGGRIETSAPKKYSIEELIRAEQIVPGSSKILMEHQKGKEAEFAQMQETKNISSAASEMLENVKFTGPVRMFNLTPETREGRQNFDTLALELEKKAAGMVGKGTLSKERFKFLKERLPSSSKTQAQNMGALKAWNKILELNMPEFEKPSQNTGVKKKDLLPPEEDRPTEKTVGLEEGPPELAGVEEEPTESMGSSLLRQIARTGSRAAESILGIPGDINEVLKDIPQALAEKLGADPERTKKVRKFVDFVSPLKFGTSQEWKNLMEKTTKGYLTPKSAAEKFSDEVTEFIAPLMIPAKGSGAIQKGKNLLSTLFKGTAATAIGKAVEGATDSEVGGKVGQIGSYILMSMFNPKGVGKYVEKLYQEANDALPKKASKFSNIKTGVYRKNLEDFKAGIEKSLSPSEPQKAIITKIDNILGSLPQEVHPERLLETKKSINTDIAKLERTAANKSERKLLNSYSKRLSGITKDTLRQYGKLNPRFFNALDAADVAHAAKEQSEWYGRLMRDVLKVSEYPLLYKGLPLLGSPVAMFKAPLTALGVPFYHMGKFAYRYAKSPALRKYYNELFKGAANANASLIRKAADKIEKELEKEDF